MEALAADLEVHENGEHRLRGGTFWISGPECSRYGNLQDQVSQLGYVCNGTVMSLYGTCGKSGCACNEDPLMRHGPYHIWTRKEKGKTVTRSLSKKRADECIENYKKLESIVEEMREISVRILEGAE